MSPRRREHTDRKLSRSFQALEPERTDQRPRRQNIKRALKKLIFYCVLLLGLASLIVLGVVEDIKVVAEENITSELVMAVDQYVDKEVPLRHALLLKREELKAHVAGKFEQHPDDITISYHPFRRTLTVSIALRHANVRWKSGETVVVLDQHGRVLRPATPVDEALLLIEDESNLPFVERDSVISERFLVAVRQAVTGIEGQGMKVTSGKVGQSSQSTKLYLDTGYYVHLNTLEDIDSQLQNLEQARAHVQASGEPITEYIDLRVVHKAYYR